MAAGESRETASAIPHYPALDELRGVAVIAVIVFHCFISTPSTSGTTIDRLTGGMVNLLSYAIDLFFVISGFLITLILDRTRIADRPIRTFYIRRALRIVPLYYGFLLFSLLFLDYLGPVATGAPGSMKWEWLFLTNFVLSFQGPGAIGALYPHFWSLAVEEQFYLVWPWVVILIPRERLMRICLAVAVLSFAGRILLAANGHTYATWFFTPTRLDGLALGSFVALLHRSAPQLVIAWSRRALVVTALLGLTVLSVAVYVAHLAGGASLTNTTGTIATPLYTSMLFAAIIAHAAARNTGIPSANPLKKLLRSVARYSYGMYALHVPLMVILFDTGKIQQRYPIAGYDLPYRLAYTLLILVLSFLVGRTTWYLYEKQMLRFAPSYRYQSRTLAEGEQKTAVQPLPVP